ncbi:MAG: universal stress protein [Candidatus Eremiobacteraeota bacterium]|nr:universal stress protein [Candidatus Eremiobacteraeota bacterium]MCW5871207.1 universal stress protein [Candidatus Eremiobacteraeota bacterium]
MCQRILVPLDGSPVAEAALEAASRLLSPEGGELVLVRMQDSSQAHDLDTNRYGDYLGLVAERWRRPGRRVSQQVLDHELRMAQGLARAAESNACDMVVLTSRGRSGLERVLAGSVAEEVARISTRPVLILGPHTPEVRRIKNELQLMSKF